MNKLVAAMIVKNEAAVLHRCFNSLVRHVDRIIVNDNGSTDDTPTIIEQLDKAIAVPGPWVDFATNRNVVLKVARQWGDYVLCGIDADEELVVPDSYVWPELTADAYNIDVHLGELVYPRVAIVRSGHPWQWRYPVQEGLYSEQPATIANLPGLYIRSHRGEGARSKDPQTQENDLKLMQEYSKAHPSDPRMTFYLGQQYKDLRNFDAAKLQYLLRLSMGGYEAERWYSQFMLGRIDEWQGRSPVLEYMTAFDMDPTRAEPLFYAADYCRRHERHACAYLFSDMARRIPMPTSGLFVERDVYDWRAQDVFATVAWYTPWRKEGKSAAGALVLSNAVPDEHRGRIIKNYDFYANI